MNVIERIPAKFQRRFVDDMAQRGYPLGGHRSRERAPRTTYFTPTRIYPSQPMTDAKTRARIQAWKGKNGFAPNLLLHKMEWVGSSTLTNLLKQFEAIAEQYVPLDAEQIRIHLEAKLTPETETAFREWIFIDYLLILSKGGCLLEEVNGEVRHELGSLRDAYDKACETVRLLDDYERERPTYDEKLRHWRMTRKELRCIKAEVGPAEGEAYRQYQAAYQNQEFLAERAFRSIMSGAFEPIQRVVQAQAQRRAQEAAERTQRVEEQQRMVAAAAQEKEANDLSQLIAGLGLPEMNPPPPEPLRLPAPEGSAPPHAEISGAEVKARLHQAIEGIPTESSGDVSAIVNALIEALKNIPGNPPT